MSLKTECNRISLNNNQSPNSPHQQQQHLIQQQNKAGTSTTTTTMNENLFTISTSSPQHPQPSVISVVGQVRHNLKI